MHSTGTAQQARQGFSVSPGRYAAVLAIAFCLAVAGWFGGAGAWADPTAAPSPAADPTSVSGPPQPAPNGVAGTDRTITLTSAGLVRTYRLFVPNASPTGAYRLIVALHPLNGTAAGFETNSNLDAGAVTTGTLVAYPAGFENSWNAGRCCATARDMNVDDVGFIDTVLDDVEARYTVDPTQVGIGGFSNGALMSYRYICERSARVAVAFIGSGAFVGPSCSFSRPVQILHMHGMKDATVPWQGTTSSPYTTDHVMPSVATTTNIMAAADGCTASWTGVAVNANLNRYRPTSCPPGAAITVYQSMPLMHGWVTGASAATTYGINETSATWTFLIGAWRANA